MAKRGYLRSIEALIAVVMLLISFYAFMNWGSLKGQSTQSIRQAAYDVFAVRGGTNVLALYDPALYDEFISTAVPSNLNYRIEADYFAPFDTFFGYNDTGYPYEVTVDFPPGSDVTSVISGDLQAGHQATFNWYRVPFFIRTREAGFMNQKVTLGLTLPYTDSNGDGMNEAPDGSSVDLYLNGTRQPFVLQSYADTGVLSRAVVAFNYTMQPNAIVDGYAYYMVGGQLERKNG